MWFPECWYYMSGIVLESELNKIWIYLITNSPWLQKIWHGNDLIFFPIHNKNREKSLLEKRSNESSCLTLNFQSLSSTRHFETSLALHLKDSMGITSVQRLMTDDDTGEIKTIYSWKETPGRQHHWIQGSETGAHDFKSMGKTTSVNGIQKRDRPFRKKRISNSEHIPI